jgi:hypothetical protein
MGPTNAHLWPATTLTVRHTQAACTPRTHAALALCMASDYHAAMSFVGELVDKAGDWILRLWERGQNFLWAVASIGTAVFMILAVGWWFGLGSGPDLFKAYGFPALIVAVGGGIFGVWRKWGAVPSPQFFFDCRRGSKLLGAITAEGRSGDHAVLLPHASYELDGRTDHTFKLEADPAPHQKWRQNTSAAPVHAASRGKHLRV